jgi:hypothetical protein
VPTRPAAIALGATGTRGSRRRIWLGEQPGELYHLPSDPQEKPNLIRREPDRARRLLRKFIAYAQQHDAPEDCLQLLRVKAETMS